MKTAAPAILLLLLVLMLMLGGCSGDPAPAEEQAVSTPQATLEAFFAGMAEGKQEETLSLYCTDASLFTTDAASSDDALIADALYSQLEYAVVAESVDEAAGTAEVTVRITTADFVATAAEILEDETYLAMSAEEREANYGALMASRLIENAIGGKTLTSEVVIHMQKAGELWQIVPDTALTMAMLGAGY